MKKIKGLYPRPNSPYYWMAYAVDGRTVRESTGQTDRKLAEQVLKAKRDLVGAARIGKATIAGPEEKSKTVSELLAAYLADCELRECRSIKAIRSNVKAVDVALGSLKAATITDETITRWKKDMVKAGVAASTINHRLQTLKQSLRPFFAKKLHQELPTITKLSETDAIRETFFTDTQAQTIIANMPEDLQDFCRWGWFTGLEEGRDLVAPVGERRSPGPGASPVAQEVEDRQGPHHRFWTTIC